MVLLCNFEQHLCRCQKLGPPKGKPRKGPWVPTPKAGKKGKGSKSKVKRKNEAKGSTFHFLKLPLELRCEVYKLVLPEQQDSQSSSSAWATMTGTPNEFMNLLVADKQISNEAREVLYGLNTFSLIISGESLLFLGSRSEHQFFPIPNKPSISFIRNWQIALWPYSDGMIESPGPEYDDAVLSICSEIVKSPELQTLKLRIPCLCQHLQERSYICRCSQEGGPCHCKIEEIDEVHDTMIRMLAPFNQLRFKERVQIVTAPEPDQGMMDDDNYDFENDYLDQYHWDNWSTKATYPYPQCQQPLCLAFAASFDPVRATLMGNTTPLRLTADQLTWQNLKAEVAKTVDYRVNGRSGSQAENISLSELWDALDSGEPEYFRKEKERVLAHCVPTLILVPRVAQCILTLDGFLLGVEVFDGDAGLADHTSLMKILRPVSFLFLFVLIALSARHCLYQGVDDDETSCTSRLLRIYRDDNHEDYIIVLK
ncbi:MAG: hypothetical protein Q9221_006711 [Calogaya cf. arnoldii]